MKQYDFALLGGGAAGLSLAYALVASPFRDRSILIVDREAKNRNDRTWCFWTKNATPYDGITHRAWGRLRFQSEGTYKEYKLDPYRYQMLRGIDFYQFVREKLSRYPNVEILRGTVEQVEDGSEAGQIVVDGVNLRATWIFDSRFQASHLPLADQGYFSLLQHFKGWEIETSEPLFDPGVATLFDLQTEQREGLSFFYILPFSERRGLVEYTLFSARILDHPSYDQALRRYIEDRLGTNNYRIIEQETGVIPMTDYPFPRRLGQRIMATGTLGGLVKPSTGYAFARIQRDSQAIVLSLHRRGHPFDVPTSPYRHRLYDSLMLSVMAQESDQVRDIFTTMFTRIPIQRILRFLDDQTTFFEDVLILTSLPVRPFLTALIKKIVRTGGYKNTRTHPGVPE